MLPSTLLHLWDLTGVGPTDTDVPDWNTTFDPIGLILLARPKNYGYWCTPQNSLTFATTGGDGVHFGLVAINDEFTEKSPVVMTVPMCDTPNTIVGANLVEFLSLGCLFGYFALEQLIYDRQETLQELERCRFNPAYESDERKMLQTLSLAFKLSPWLEPEQRLEELEALYSGWLQIPIQEENSV